MFQITAFAKIGRVAALCLAASVAGAGAGGVRADEPAKAALERARDLRAAAYDRAKAMAEARKDYEDDAADGDIAGAERDYYKRVADIEARYAKKRMKIERRYHAAIGESRRDDEDRTRQRP